MSTEQKENSGDWVQNEIRRVDIEYRTKGKECILSAELKKKKGYWVQNKRRIVEIEYITNEKSEGWVQNLRRIVEIEYITKGKQERLSTEQKENSGDWVHN